MALDTRSRPGSAHPAPTSTLPPAPLTPEQHAAVHWPHAGPALLVLAGAGTGKTLTLAARVAWLVQQGLDPQRLLLLTFSRRAAAEMTQRAGRLLHRAAGLPATAPPPALRWAGTFHAIAATLLREHAAALGLPAGFTVLDRGDAQELMTQVRQQQGLTEAQGRQRFPLAETCVAIASRCVNTGEPLHAVLAQHYPWCAPHQTALRTLFAAFTAAKQAQHALDFDDLLLAWHVLLQHPRWGPTQRARWDHVLVDEVQDLNALQAGIVHALRPGGQGLTAVGDDAQSIYSFRGAHPRHILDLPARCDPPAKVLALTRNHRSTPALLAASNAVIAGWSQGFPKALWSTRTPGPRPRLVTVADEAAQARGVADAVLAAREQGTALKRQAVLFRTGTHSAALELELARRQIPTMKYGGLKFLESAHVKDLLALLRWADNPAATLAAQRVARRVPGLGPATVARLATHTGALEALPVSRAAAPGWAALCALLQMLRSAALPWPADLRAALDWLAPQLERLHDDARVRIAELEQLALLAAQHRSRSAFVTELALDPPAASGDEAGPPLRDEDWLVLSTIHAAKGQEWSAVHVLNVVDGGIPSDMATGDADAIEEERRLLYVAMTRARDSLALWMPLGFHVRQQAALGDRHVHAVPSRFITPALWPLFERLGVGEAVSDAEPALGAPGPVPAAAPEGLPAAATPDDAPGDAPDLWAALRAPWAGPSA